MRIVKTEVFFVFLVTVVLFYHRMCERTVFSLRTFLLFFDILTHLRIKVTISLPIFSVMVIYAMLVIVSFSNVAGMNFKVI